MSMKEEEDSVGVYLRNDPDETPWVPYQAGVGDILKKNRAARALEAVSVPFCVCQADVASSEDSTHVNVITV